MYLLVSTDEDAGGGHQAARARLDVSRDDLERICMRNLLEASEERIYFKDLDSRFILVSRGFMLYHVAKGLLLDDVIGKSDFDLFSEEHARAAFEDEQRIIRTGEPIVAKIERETFRDRPDAWVSTTKLPLRDDHGQVVGTFGISRDVTAQVQAEEALAYQALHDPLTGLANRLAFTDRLAQALLALERAAGTVGLLFIDLDNFKEINDSFGHSTGDRVLVEVGRRLSRAARTGDTVARFGGDEFAVLCQGLRNGPDVAQVAHRVLAALSKPLVDQGRDLTVSASIGVVTTDNPQANPGELLRQADMAMYEAKAAGRNCVRVHNPALPGPPAGEDDSALALLQAVEQRQLFVVYQPLFALEDRSLLGAEALARWQHPQRGVVLPGEFIALAERHGLVGLVDDFVLEEACRQLAQWLGNGLVGKDFTMAVNVSGQQLSDPALPQKVAAVLNAHGVAPRQLCLEVSEEALLGRSNEVQVALSGLARLGVHLAVDDFGTSTTLSYLGRLNVDMLKIDRRLVAEVATGPSQPGRVVAAITTLAHALGMSAVGVGLEDEGQLAAIAKAGCDGGQGYLLGQPLQPEQLAALWRAQQPPPRRRARPEPRRPPSRAQPLTRTRSASPPARRGL